ncbi:MAG: PTS sugar transporter subunit IIC [Clostridium chrysemydis]|uniref:PTS sugar transporter subunit IIC n=1 Tax=Clostridium chrysemydis TaxID=2665504 RepID=UPI003F2CFAA9
MKFMDKFAAWLEKVMMPIASKLGSQKHLAALRDGFIAYLPISLIGAVGTMMLNVLLKPDSLVGRELMKIEAYKTSVFPFLEKYVNPVFNQMWWATLAMTTIYLVITIAYAYGRSQEVDPLATAIVALGAYLAMVPDSQVLDGLTSTIKDVTLVEKVPETLNKIAGTLGVAPDALKESLVGADFITTTGTWGQISWGSFNSTAMFAGILVALFSAQLFCFIVKKGLVIKLPDQVPPAVSRSFAAVIPGILTVMVFAIISMIFLKVVGTDYKTWIDATIQKPLEKLGQSPFTYIGLITFSQLLWFFGLHGMNMVEPALNTMYLPTLNQNIELVAQGKEAIHTFTRNFVDVYAMPGGSGATFALIISIMIFSKRQEQKELAKLAFAPGLFQINEPVIFGLPIVLNPIYFIPFVLTPGILLTIAYLATEAGMVEKIQAFIPWTTPPVLSAFLATNGDFKAAILAALLFVVALIIWTPFVIASNKMAEDAE